MTTEFEDFDFDNILIEEKSYENILVHNSSYKSLICDKSLRSRFHEIDVFIRVYDGTTYLVLLFGAEKCDFIYNKIIYLVGVKSGVTYDITHNKNSKIKVDLHDSLLLQKRLTFHNVIIHIKPVWNKDQNRFYCNMFLEKGSYQLNKNNYNK